MRKTLCSIAFAAVLAALALPANAHAVLVSSSPRNNAVVKTAPASVTLKFDARIEKSVTHATLLDARRHKIALPKADYKAGPADTLIVPMPKLQPGRYRLEYQVMATDGHLTPGFIEFTVAGGKSP